MEYGVWTRAVADIHIPSHVTLTRVRDFLILSSSQCLQICIARPACSVGYRRSRSRTCSELAVGDAGLHSRSWLTPRSVGTRLLSRDRRPLGTHDAQ